jgi:hypothetical protein
MTEQGVPPPNLPLSSSDGEGSPDAKNSKEGSENIESEVVGAPAEVKPEVPDFSDVEQPIQGGKLPGGGVDAPDPLIEASESKPVVGEVKPDSVTKSDPLPELPEAKDQFEPVAGDTVVKDEVVTPQSMAEAAPLAPTAFNKPDMPHKKKRRWVLIVGGIVVVVFIGIVGAVAVRFFINMGEEVLPVDVVVDEETDNGEVQDEVVVDVDNVLINEINGGEEANDGETEVISSEEAILDSDEDGLTVAEERFYGTDSELADTDGDGYKDGEEVRAGYDPLGPGKLDSDNDGFPDPDEREFGSDPFNPDTDGDGFNDGDEIQNGHNPLIPSPDDTL